MTRFVCRLAGGMGNQMFQYSMVRALALRHGSQFSLDLTALIHSNPEKDDRHYELGAFLMSPEISQEPEGGRSDSPHVTLTLCETPHTRLGDLPSMLGNIDHTIHIEGFWQNPDFFDDFKDQIREDFVFRCKDEKPRPQRHEILGCSDAVCVHVRRGDYLEKAGSHLGFVGLEYFEQAIRWIQERVAFPHFFVFSDDIMWCESNLRFSLPHTFVSSPVLQKGDTSYEMFLMSLCKHFIISNSTYSWWAAWLSKSDLKLVVTPERWFSKPPYKSALSLSNWQVF